MPAKTLFLLQSQNEKLMHTKFGLVKLSSESNFTNDTGLPTVSTCALSIRSISIDQENITHVDILRSEEYHQIGGT